MRLEGKIALVTGAARGIGAAIARRFAAEGARLIVNDLNLDRANSVTAEIGGIAIAADVADPAAVRDMFARVRRDTGGLDVLVNNAGINGHEGAPDKFREVEQRALAQAMEAMSGSAVSTHLDVTVNLTDDEWRRMIAVHLDGTFFCSREAICLMSERGRGAILNMASIMGTSGGGGVPHYAAAKAGILGLTRSLAQELATRNIRVNAVAPGWIDTDMTSMFSDQGRRMIELRTPMLRFGDVDDIANAAVYLASDESKFVTGQVLSPNGGWYMSQ
jgi:NAD(P)-dependent dehydrogenase (short-subunit alcohol dehydrogenase family)